MQPSHPAASFERKCCMEQRESGSASVLYKNLSARWRWGPNTLRQHVYLLTSCTTPLESVIAKAILGKSPLQQCDRVQRSTAVAKGSSDRGCPHMFADMMRFPLDDNRPQALAANSRQLLNQKTHHQQRATPPRQPHNEENDLREGKFNTAPVR